MHLFEGWGNKALYTFFLTWSQYRRVGFRNAKTASPILTSLAIVVTSLMSQTPLAYTIHLKIQTFNLFNYAKATL